MIFDQPQWFGTKLISDIFHLFTPTDALRNWLMLHVHGGKFWKRKKYFYQNVFHSLSVALRPCCQNGSNQGDSHTNTEAGDENCQERLTIVDNIDNSSKKLKTSNILWSHETSQRSSWSPLESPLMGRWALFLILRQHGARNRGRREVLIFAKKKYLFLQKKKYSFLLN